MLIRVIFLTFVVLVSTIMSQNYAHLHQESKRRIGHRLPNFLRFKDPVEKRRIGLRLPNMLKFKDNGVYPNFEKRRMGMRLPNIIFLRNEKKNVLDY